MKIFKTLFAPPFIRFIVYKCIRRLSGGAAVSLVWKRFINTGAEFSITEQAFLFLGFLFLTLAWFNYLYLDGIRIQGLAKIFDKSAKKEKRKKSAMIDFTDSEPDKTVELSDDQRVWTSLAANFITGLVFLAVSLADTYVLYSR